MIYNQNFKNNSQCNEINLKDKLNKSIKYYVKNIKISGFRNHDKIQLNLNKKPVVLHGSNGIGKTNILEAISFLNPGRGLRKAKSKDIFLYNSKKEQSHVSFWGVNADIITPKGCFNIGSGSDNKRSSRVIKINSNVSNQTELSKIFKVSWITPQMLLIFHTSMNEKRRFLDRLVNYFNPLHVTYIYKYEKFSRERSKIINQFNKDDLWLESLENNIINLAFLIIKNRNMFKSELNKIYNQDFERKSFITSFPLLEIGLKGEIENWIEKEEEKVCKSRLLNIMKQNRKNNDTYFAGPHNSTITIFNKTKQKEISFCSTGEQKLMLISLILNHSRLLDFLYDVPPILLLDDIVEHLDEYNKNILFEETAKYKSQCWFTSTNIKFFDNYPISCNRINLETMINKYKINEEYKYA